MSFIRFSLTSIKNLKQKSTIAIILASSFVLMISGLAVNESQPVVYNHYNYMSIVVSEIGNSTDYNIRGFILDTNLRAETNATYNFEKSSTFNFFGGYNYSSCIQLVLHDLQSQKRVTNSDGLFSFEIKGPGSTFAYPYFQQVMADFQYEFTYSMNNISGSQLDTMVYSSLTNYISFFPYYNLGNYGTAAVVFIPGNSSNTFSMSYETYSNLTTNTSSTLSLGKFHYGIPQRIGNYNQILAMNEAYSVSFYLNNAFYSNTNFPSNSNSYSFSSGFGFIVYFFSAVSVIFITVIIATSIFDKPVNEFYMSIPEKRRDILLTSVILGTVGTFISSVIAFLLGNIISLVFYSSTLMLSTLSDMVIFNLFLFAVISPIYFLMGVYTRYGTGIKIGITLMLVIGVPLITSILETLFFVTIFASTFGLNQASLLYLPQLQQISEINLFTGLIPLTAPLDLFNYMVKSPFTGVEMLNHLSIFYLSPLIFFSPLITWLVPLIYLSIRKYDRI